MYCDFFNGEHYPDPTAYAAIMNIDREERRRKKAKPNRALRKPRETPGPKPEEEAITSASDLPA